MKRLITQIMYTLPIIALMFAGYVLADCFAVIFNRGNESIFRTLPLPDHLALLILAGAVICAMRLIIRLAISKLMKKQTLKVKVLTIHLCLSAGLMTSIIEWYIYLKFGYIKVCLIIFIRFLYGYSLLFYTNDICRLIQNLRESGE